MEATLKLFVGILWVESPPGSGRKRVLRWGWRVDFSFESSRYHDLRSETRLKAIGIAKKKAADLTEALDAKLGQVMMISELLESFAPFKRSICQPGKRGTRRRCRWDICKRQVRSTTEEAKRAVEILKRLKTLGTAEAKAK